MQSEVARLQQTQAEHAERIARLERRQDEDARVKSVWGNSSPFPNALTPQQGESHAFNSSMPTNIHVAPLQQPSSEFRIDDDTNNMMSSLHLDAEEEPRRALGSASRANSVRFDESANQNHVSHLSKPSLDYLSRTSSALGGLGLGERSTSHKSDGRASSVHSIRSGASGRANSLNLDTAYGAADSSRSSQELPSIAPGLLLLGSVPAIIRCWMNLKFTHNALLYAAVCTGSYKSYVSEDLVHKLGFEEHIEEHDEGNKTIELPVYFPEAVPHPGSSRPNSPAPQLPVVTVHFELTKSNAAKNKAIQIFLGSDTLQMHNADILFSSKTMTLFDDDRCKLRIPLVRPEDEDVFNSLRIASTTEGNALKAGDAVERPQLNGLAAGASDAAVAAPSTTKYRPPMAMSGDAAGSEAVRSVATSFDQEARPASRASNASRPSLNLTARTESQDTESSGQGFNSHRSASSSPAVWSNWRKEPANTPTSAIPSSTLTPTPAALDWASASKNREQPYQRKDTGIKVLKPKSASRAFSSSATTPTAGTSSPIGENKTSRFFDDGRRKSDKKEDLPMPAAKTRTNPIGGGSAFSWLNSSNDPK